MPWREAYDMQLRYQNADLLKGSGQRQSNCLRWLSRLVRKRLPSRLFTGKNAAAFNSSQNSFGELTAVSQLVMRRHPIDGSVGSQQKRRHVGTAQFTIEKGFAGKNAIMCRKFCLASEP